MEASYYHLPCFVLNAQSRVGCIDLVFIVLVELISPKTTTQRALLERFLAIARSRRVKGLHVNKSVLDFGCGLHAWNARNMNTQAKLVHGIDASVQEPFTLDKTIKIFSSFDQLPVVKYELIVALAVFEHIPPFDLVKILTHLSTITTPDALIFGTVPTPQARPVLELLSFKLGLIDTSQIKDHWVYYDDLWLSEILSLTPWKLHTYKKFQLGLNSEFILSKNDVDLGLA